MRIESAGLAMQAQHTYVSRTQESQRMEAWGGPEPRRATQTPNIDPALPTPEEPVAPGVSAPQAALPSVASAGISPQAALHAQAAEASGKGLSNLEELRSEIILRTLEKLTGRRMPRSARIEVDKAESTCTQTDPSAAEGSAEPNWGIRIEVHREHYEAETTGFQARAVVHTADGNTIDVCVNLNLSREFYQREDLLVEMGNAVKDPLVIHYAGDAPGLLEETFQLDIDGDGQAENLAIPTAGNGFLALDRNGDGAINDGTELFGPSRGDGFAELADHDTDGNGWIDENDDVFTQLGVWVVHPDGEDELLALADLEIGAIALENAETPFAFRTPETNRLLGMMRSTSVALREDGSAATVHQIDLAV